MNKILTLYDLEFKRVKKVYFSILSLLTLSNISLFIFYLYFLIKEISNTLNIRGGIGIIKSEESYKILKNGELIYSIYGFSMILMVLTLMWCLYYTFIIWYKDFFSKTKVAYTLFTLPFNKFNVFLSKLMIVVSFIYGVIVIQHIMWILEIFFIEHMTGININDIIDIINYNFSMSIIRFLGGIYPLDRVMYLLFGPVILVIILFTGIMIHKSFNKIGGFLGIFYVILCIFMYILISRCSILHTDQLLKSHILYYISVGILSIWISYKLLNGRVNV